MAYEYEKENKEAVMINPPKANKELQEVYHKAKAFDELKKHVDEEVDSYMALYRQTKDPIYSLLNSHYDTLLGLIEELERADDERWTI